MLSFALGSCGGEYVQECEFLVVYERWQFVVGSERTCSGIVNGGFETERYATLVPSGGGEKIGA